MAKIIWTTDFEQQLDHYISNAGIEYGRSTAKKWAKEVAAIEQRLRSYPTSYTPESLLLGRDKVYRRCHVMHRRFKIIYYYDQAEDTVHIVDIWDTRMNPKTLIQRIR